MSKRSLDGSNPKNCLTRSSVAAECLPAGDVRLDLLDFVFGESGLVGDELPEFVPAEEGRGLGQGRLQVPLERLEVPVGHRQLGQARIVALAHDLWPALPPPTLEGRRTWALIFFM